MSRQSILNDPEITAKIRELIDHVDALAETQGRHVDTFIVIARGPEGNSFVIGGHICPGCMAAIAHSLIKVGNGDESFRENPSEACHVH